MNATHPVSRTPSTPASVNSSKPGGPAPDFAAALTGAAAKPARKAGGHKTAGTGVIGGHLPADGNVSPPAAPPAPAGSAAASAASLAAGTVGNAATAAIPGTTISGAKNSGAAINGAAAKIPDPAPGSGGTAPGGAAAAPDSLDAGPIGAAAMKFGAGFALALGLPLDPAAPVAPGADGTPLASTSGNPSPAVSTVAAPSIPAAALAGSEARVTTPRHATDTAAATAATAALKAATSGSSSNEGASGTATNAGTASADGTAAPAAAAMSVSAAAMSAAAMSAAAAGVAVSNGDDFAGAADAPSLTADAMVSPGAKAVPGTQVPNGAPALAATRAAAATAAHANAQAASAVADAGASDKHAAGGADTAPLPGIPGDAAAGAAQSVNPSIVTGSAPAPALTVPAGVDTPEFGQGIADRVSWMVDNNLNGAKLQVNPPQLGPIEVRISVQGGHAQVWFTSHSAVTRDALESSSPKLREMLGAQGFGQVSVDISQGSFHERPAYSQPYDWAPSANRSPSSGSVQSTAISPRTSSGALDAYA